MANPSPALINGIVRGRTIELERAPGLPDGQQVDVAIRPVEDAPRWLEHLMVDPSV